MTYTIESQQLVHAPLEQVFEFFSQARNLEELTPPWLRFSVVAPGPIEMREGTLIEYRLRVRAAAALGLPHRGVAPRLAVRRPSGPRPLQALVPHP
jgi:ligand-binding SRPBCC domain-containing protein